MRAFPSISTDLFEQQSGERPACSSTQRMHAGQPHDHKTYEYFNIPFTNFQNKNKYLRNSFTSFSIKLGFKISSTVNEFERIFFHYPWACLSSLLN